jgi:hypothetical protein
MRVETFHVAARRYVEKDWEIHGCAPSPWFATVDYAT